MEIIKQGGWIYYCADNLQLFNNDKIGKWMYFFDDKKFITKICKDIVEMNIVSESKHTDAETGVACFYLNCDDIQTHKKIISYFMENNLIRKTKKGRLYNIAFKLNKQTNAREYGNDFKAKITLSDFIDLSTGNWRL